MNEIDRMVAMVERDLRDTAHLTGRARLSPAVLNALRQVRRDAFVPEQSVSAAYENAPLRIGHGQTISQPFIVALMTDFLDLKQDSNVLEIGTGSGYQAAMLAALSDRVCSIEAISALADSAARALAREQCKVVLRCGDGRLGWPERAPFDAIIVTAAGRDIPAALIAQLAPGGRMVLPVGEPDGEQALQLVSKGPDGAVNVRSILPVAFVPLTGGG